MRLAYVIEPPFAYCDPSGEIVGCDIELATDACAAIGEPIEPVEADFADLLPGLAAGRWRMTTGLFVTEERRRVAAFSQPIWALADGLLVRDAHAPALDGYRSVARHPNCRLAVVRDQVQHRVALDFGVPPERIGLYRTYADAAAAVGNGRADAFASVARAHAGFLAVNRSAGLACVDVPPTERPAARGAFAFSLVDAALRDVVDAELGRRLGGPEHRALMACYGFSDADVDRLSASR